MNILGFIGVGDLAEYTIKGLRQGGFDKSIVDSSDVIVLETRPAYCIEVLKVLVFKQVNY
jgi:pyrroline-5-carboxylate reductase|tara:strand:+ start:780 stop:959 length:180 start_codon:yes stop_codon:yes gene_type:complete